PVGLHLVHERLHLLAPHAGGRGLETGRSGGVEQTLQELQRRFGHGCAEVESGMPSRRRTLSAAAPVASVGSGFGRDMAEQPVIVRRGGWRIAFFAITRAW